MNALNPAALAALVTAVATLALLWADARASRLGVWASKPLASLGFVIVAWTLGHADTYSQLVLAALAACWLGDVLLIPEDPRAFQAGVASFALGHLLYVAAFLERGVRLSVLLASAALLSLLAARVWRWLAPHLPAALKPAVAGYVIIITGMVAAALGTVARHVDARIALGALMFFVSDLSVARDKFVAPSFNNRLWGLPLYYAAQLLLASSVG